MTSSDGTGMIDDSIAMRMKISVYESAPKNESRESMRE
jgi:hypothetical protein